MIDNWLYLFDIVKNNAFETLDNEMKLQKQLQNMMLYNVNCKTYITQRNKRKTSLKYAIMLFKFFRNCARS